MTCWPGCQNATFSTHRPASGPMPSRRRASSVTVRLRRTHQDSASSPGPPSVVAAETAFTAANPTGCAGLSIEPDILHTKVVDDVVDHHRPALHRRLPAIGEAVVEDDRAGPVLRQLSFDLPHQLPTRSRIGFNRLPIEQLFELGIAIAGV